MKSLAASADRSGRLKCKLFFHIAVFINRS